MHIHRINDNRGDNRRGRCRFSVVAIAVGVLVAVIAVLAGVKGMSVKELLQVSAGVVGSKVSKHTTSGRLADIERKKPGLRTVADSVKGRLNILVFKEERMVELHAQGWKEPRKYPMTAFSGRLGPKLQEGDGQIPEGVYGIEYLNPNSSYYLSLKVSYPNVRDRARAQKDGRTRLGGDIMIHGRNVTVGCVPVGDDAIEDIFYLAGRVGVKNLVVVIAPYDMRKGRRPELEKSDLDWYPELLKEIESAVNAIAGKSRPPR